MNERIISPIAPPAHWIYPNASSPPLLARHSANSAVSAHTAKNPAWEYEFDLGRATHGAEVPYVFGTSPDPNIQTYWTNFAKTGNPNGHGAPEWPPFDPTNRKYIEFTKDGPVAGDRLRRNFCNLYVENVNRLIGH